MGMRVQAFDFDFTKHYTAKNREWTQVLREG